MHDRQARFAWLMGASNAVLAVAAVDVVYTVTSSGGLYLISWWLTLPYGAVVAWRSSVFVRELQQDRARLWRPPLEGFLLLFLSAVVALSYGIMRAHLAGVPQTGWGWDFWSLAGGQALFYSVPIGLIGAAIAFLLMVFDILLIELVLPTRRASRRAGGPATKPDSR